MLNTCPTLHIENLGAFGRSPRKTAVKVAPDLEKGNSGRRKSVQLTLNGGPMGRTPSITAMPSFDTENSMTAIEQVSMNSG